MYKNIQNILEMKNKEKITVLTGYDSTMVTLCDQVDIILVGDSAGMVMLGYEDTSSVTMEDMIRFTTAAKNGRKNSLIVSDLPINSYKTEKDAIRNSLKLIEAGADAVKFQTHLAEEEMLDTKIMLAHSKKETVFDLMKKCELNFKIKASVH